MAANHGLITRYEALDCGLSPGVIRALLSSGALVALRRGVYIDGEVWRDLDPHRGQPLQRARAAIRTMRRGWVLSHESSGHLQSMELLLPTTQFVHVTRPGFTNAWTEHGVKHHLAGFRDEQVVRIDGLPALDMARTAVDIAREHGRPYGEVACDAAMRRGVTRGQLEAAVEPMRSWSHVVRSRQAVAFARPGTGSVVETLARELVEELGVEAPIEIQFPVRRPDGRVAWLDIVVGCHGVEADGKTKYIPVADGGVATRPPYEVLWDEKKRERDLHRIGLGISRVFFEDYWGDRRVAALKRLREEYDETVSRFGTRLPDRLLREARELRGQAGA